MFDQPATQVAAEAEHATEERCWECYRYAKEIDQHEDLVLRMLKGHCVYSRHWRSDLWLHLKNKNIFLSQWLVHPHHPFTKWERHGLLLASFVLALGLEMIFCVHFESCADENQDFVSLFLNVSADVVIATTQSPWLPPSLLPPPPFKQVIVWKILIGASMNGIYDALIENLVTCSCLIDRCSRGCFWCLECISGVAILGLIGFAVLVLLSGITLISTMKSESPAGHIMMMAVKELMIGKIVGLGVVTSSLDVVGFLVGRAAQMKPDPNDLGARKKWDEPHCFGPKKSMMWYEFGAFFCRHNETPS